MSEKHSKISILKPDDSVVKVSDNKTQLITTCSSRLNINSVKSKNHRRVNNVNYLNSSRLFHISY